MNPAPIFVSIAVLAIVTGILEIRSQLSMGEVWERTSLFVDDLCESKNIVFRVIGNSILCAYLMTMIFVGED